MSEPVSLPEAIGASGIGTDDATLGSLAGAMAAGSVTASEIAAHYLARVERLNPVLHAVISVNEQAISEAQASDAARAAGAVPRPLEGIPVLVKDNLTAEGMPATAGSPALAGAQAPEASCVTRLREAGAVILGKANLSEWANFRSRNSASGWSTLGGQTANPHAPGRNPSGSSSGSGCGVAAGLAPLAIGTETDGSIVCPASACGIVGIKPTVGLVSRAGIVPVSLAQDTAGPMARTVADAAALLSVLSGPDPADPATAGAVEQSRDYTAYLDSGALAGARLGVWRDGSQEAGTGVPEVLENALSILREAGAVVVDPVELPGAGEISEPEFTALAHEFKHDLNAYLAGLGGDHPATLADIISFNRDNAARILAHFGQDIFELAEATPGELTDAKYVAARTEAGRRAKEALDGPLAAHRLDAVITLTANPAWLTDYVLGDHDVFHTSGPAAVAGYPSVTVPAGSVAGLPVGLSFTGAAWSEPALISLAYAFEQAANARITPDLELLLRHHAAAGGPPHQR